MRRVSGIVVYDLSGKHQEGANFNQEILSKIYQHGHILVRTAGHNILLWVEKEHAKQTKFARDEVAKTKRMV